MNSPAAEEYFRRQLAVQDAGFWMMAVFLIGWAICEGVTRWKGRKGLKGPKRKF